MGYHESQPARSSRSHDASSQPQPELDGLEIAPIIPKNWPGFIATRLFRGVVYNIVIERKGEGNAIALTVDGKAIEGNVVLPPIDGRKEVEVKAILS